MANLLFGLQLATQAAFVLLALAAVIEWARHRDSRRSHLAVAFGSLGLGLWLSREIARIHDSALTVESTLGQGSTFTLQLPLTL